MLDLLLINPSGREEIYQDLDELTAKEPPLWCRLIAGYIRDRGFSVQILDADAEDLCYRDVGRIVANKHPRLVGMIVYGHQPNASSQQMGPALKTCKAIKDFGDFPILMAGGTVSVLPTAILAEDDVDFVAIGEGAVTIEHLLGGTPYKDIPGFVWDGGQNPPPPNLPMSALHGDVWDMLPMEKYRSHNWQTNDRIPYASVHTSLGCPYQCVFCCINAPFGGSGYRVRDPSEVVKEIRKLHDEYGVRTFKIVDEMFVLKPSHYIPICEGLAELDLDINIWAYARIDTVKPDTLTLLRKAGIRWLALGIESGSEHVRDGAAKAINEQDIHDIVKAIQDAGIKVIGNFIFGLQDDTFETMQQTLDLAKTLKCDFVNFYSAMAYPGSKLFTQANPEDLPETWSGYSQHSYDCKPLPTDTLTSAEVLRFRDYAHRHYFEGQGRLAEPLKRKILGD